LSVLGSPESTVKSFHTRHVPLPFTQSWSVKPHTPIRMMMMFPFLFFFENCFCCSTVRMAKWAIYLRWNLKRDITAIATTGATTITSYRRHPILNNTAFEIKRFIWRNNQNPIEVHTGPGIESALREKIHLIIYL